MEGFGGRVFIMDCLLTERTDEVLLSDHRYQQGRREVRLLRRESRPRGGGQTGEGEAQRGEGVQNGEEEGVD
jgi:hypothetical protein